MSPPVVWRYLADGKVKHAFYAPVRQMSSARCGVGPRWWDPTGWKGAATAKDIAELDRLQRCKRCVDSLSRDRSAS